MGQKLKLDWKRPIVKYEMDRKYGTYYKENGIVSPDGEG